MQPQTHTKKIDWSYSYSIDLIQITQMDRKNHKNDLTTLMGHLVNNPQTLFIFKNMINNNNNNK